MVNAIFKPVCIPFFCSLSLFITLNICTFWLLTNTRKLSCSHTWPKITYVTEREASVSWEGKVIWYRECQASLDMTTTHDFFCSSSLMLLSIDWIIEEDAWDRMRWAHPRIQTEDAKTQSNFHVRRPCTLLQTKSCPCVETWTLWKVKEHEYECLGNSAPCNYQLGI